MKFKTVCASIAVTTSIATGMIFVPQNHALAQNTETNTQRTNPRAQRSLEIQWILGFLPWPTWYRNSNSFSSRNSGNGITFPNNPSSQNSGNNITVANKPNNIKPIGKKPGANHKEVPVPILIPGLAALGAGLVRKHRQEQKQMEMK